MKKFILIFFCLGFFASANAQFKFGLRAGLNSHYVKADDFTQGQYTISQVKGAKVGFHGGLMMQVSFFGVFLQPELLLSSVGNEIEIENLGEVNLATQKFTKLDIPVLIGKRFEAFRIGAGPVATIMLNSTSELEDLTGIKEKFSTSKIGFQAGVGVDIAQSIALDLKYEGSLTKLGKGVNIGGTEYDFDSRASQIIFSIGFLF